MSHIRQIRDTEAQLNECTAAWWAEISQCDDFMLDPFIQDRFA